MTEESSVVAVLNKVGLYLHLAKKKNDHNNAQQSTVRISKILIWTFHTKTLTSLEATNAIDWFEELTEKNYLLFQKFAEYLHDPPQSKKPGTIITYMDNLACAIKWLAYFSSDKDKDQIRRLSLDQISGAMEMINIVRKDFRGRVQKLCTKTMAVHIRERKLPEGGLLQLQQCIMDAAKSLFKLEWTRVIINKLTFCTFLQALYTAFYVLNINGRVGGLMHLTIEDGTLLVTTGRAMSLLFKTQGTYVAQPVLANDVTRGLLEIYLRFIRPWAKLQSLDPNAAFVKESNGQHVERLFLTHNGEAQEHAGREVTNFFHKHDLHVTTNTMRSLMETLSAKKFRSGEITQAQHESTHNINGHSGKTTRDWYILDAREEDATHAQEVVDTHFTMVDESFNSTTPLLGNTGSTSSSSAYVTAPDAWGHARFDYNDSLKKAEWTFDEKCFIGDFCLEELQQYSDSPEQLAIAEHTLVSTCLAYIRFVCSFDLLEYYYQHHQS
jgi:hypothetical protein